MAPGSPPLTCAVICRALCCILRGQLFEEAPARVRLRKNEAWLEGGGTRPSRMNMETTALASSLPAGCKVLRHVSTKEQLIVEVHVNLKKKINVEPLERPLATTP